MYATYEIWKMLTGIVIFLLGSSFLEESIKSLGGRSFKLFLQKQTSGKLKAIAGGAVVTGVIQSSSVVNLMVLAFVGAGVIHMENALAIMLGSNLGTTIDSWIVATLGFKFSIEVFAYPIAGVAGMAMLLSNKERKLYQWSKLFFGFAFLFVGLGFVKTGMQDVIKIIDLSAVNKQPAIVFLLIGLLVTAIIQSSSAAIVIVLSALNTNAISLLAATAYVLGAEVGTTLKLILASAKGSADKKRVALGNILINTTSVLVLFAVLVPVNKLITEVIGIKDNLIALVFFQSLLNIITIFIFYPFLKPFGRFLEKRFLNSDDETLFIHKVKVTDTEPAIVALEKETVYLLYYTAAYTLEALGKHNTLHNTLHLNKNFNGKTILEKYEQIKHLHGDIYSYATKLQQYVNDKEMAIRLHQLTDAARNTMYAAKNIKDALPDIEQFSKSSKSQKYEYFLQTGNWMTDFFLKILPLLKIQKENGNYEIIASLYKTVQENYKEMLAGLHREDLQKNLTEVEFSTFVNFNREIFSCKKSIVFAIKEFLLTEEEANRFDELPGFIR